MSSILSTPGTPTERPPTTALRNARGRPCASRKRSGVAAAGAVSRPSNATTCVPSYSKSNAPPPMPEDCGSVKPSIIWAAMAASTAEPPCCNISWPASVASGCAVAIIARVARTTAFSRKPVALSGAISGLSGAGGTCMVCTKLVEGSTPVRGNAVLVQPYIPRANMRQNKHPITVCRVLLPLLIWTRALDADAQEHAPLAFHGAPVVGPVGVLSGHAAVVINQEFHGVRERDHFGSAIDLHPWAGEAIVEHPQGGLRDPARLERFIGGLAATDEGPASAIDANRRGG